MKHIKYLLLILFMLPINIYAYELKCPEGPFTYGNTFVCEIKGDNSGEFDELSGSISYGSNNILSCRVSAYGDGLQINRQTPKESFSFIGKSASDTLVSFVCEVTEKNESSITQKVIIEDLKTHILDSNKDAEIEVLRSNDIVIKAYEEVPQEEVDDRPRKTDNPDSRLKLISDEQLDFVFSQFKTVYDLSVLFEVEDLNLHIVTNNEAATYEIRGDQHLSIGMNVIDIFVTGPDGSQTCYTLNINRLKRGEDIYYPEKDASLKSLSVDEANINFESIVYDYKIHLSYDVNYITVRAATTVEDAKYTVSSTDDIKNGDTVSVTVTSADGSNSMTYMIHITKDPAPKDYKPIIFISLIILGIGIVIFIIIKTNQKNKTDPLLRLKGDRSKVNYGKKLDMNDIPDAGAGVDTSGNINTIDLTTTAKPIETEEVLDLNMNQTTSVVTTLDLSNAKLPNETVVQQVQPVVQQQPVQPVAQVQQPVQQQPVQPVAQVQQPVQVQQSVPIQPTPVIEQPKEPEIPQPLAQPEAPNPNIVTSEPPKESNIFD